MQEHRSDRYAILAVFMMRLSRYQTVAKGRATRIAPEVEGAFPRR
jgi:hypothetical protein